MIGQTISHYKIQRKLGEGGMGVVYQAEDTKLGRTVALKFLPLELTRDQGAKSRFIQEARSASALDHPNICTIHDIDETADGRMYIVMACYDGESLKTVVGKGRLEFDEVIGIVRGIVEGLSQAHRRGIIHRDIKPANILLTAEGRTIIADFGLAKLAGQTGITKTGTTVGTAAYMSPEQIRGDALDHRTDIWSLGVSLYELITGRLPFRAEYDQAVMYSILNEQPPPVRDLRPDTPAALAAIAGRALAKAPDERYQQVQDILPDLESVREPGPGRARMAEPARLVGEQSLPSIAVLPFVSMSPDPENAYFGDGLAEELINGLTRLRGLRVAARTSAFRFRGEDVDIREIGRQLGVGTVLEGSVRKSGNRLRVTAQLINIEDGYHLWSDRYDREMKDIFDIQDEIAAAIVNQLEVKLAVRKDQPLIKRYTDNLEAYSLFLKGQYHLFSLTPEGWVKSFELYRQAIELDPSFALAHAWQSQNYQSLCFWGDGRPRREMENSRSAAREALRLDEDLALAHEVMAVIQWSYDWRWDEAERGFKKVFELDPTEPFNHVNYSLFLAAAGRHDEAIAQSELAQKLDPLSSVISSWRSISLMAAGRYDEAIDCLRRAIALDPNHWQAYHHLSRAYLYNGEIEEALAASRKAMEFSGEASATVKEGAVIHYLAGNSSDGDRLLAQLSERAGRGYVPPCAFAEIHLVRGENNKALKHLEQAVWERDPWLVMVHLNPPQTRPSGPEMEAVLEPVGIPTSG